MLCQKVITKKTSFVFLIIAGLFLADINITKAVGWTPLTDLSSFGIPPGPISLSDFIIFIYDFLLSAVGIAAMLMIVLGGFRYLTAAGNAASLTEAKDIIYNALYGLALAICAWIIISTINPDLIYLKKPGADVSNLNYSCIGTGVACNTDAAQDGCNTGSLVDPDCQLAGATPAEGDGCDPTASPADNDCFYETANCCNGTCSLSSIGVCPEKPPSCIAIDGWPAPMETIYHETPGKWCKCVDGDFVLVDSTAPAGTKCEDVCTDPTLVDVQDDTFNPGSDSYHGISHNVSIGQLFSHDKYLEVTSSIIYQKEPVYFDLTNIKDCRNNIVSKALDFEGGGPAAWGIWPDEVCCEQRVTACSSWGQACNVTLPSPPAPPLSFIVPECKNDTYITEPKGHLIYKHKNLVNPLVPGIYEYDGYDTDGKKEVWFGITSDGPAGCRTDEFIIEIDVIAP